jgi:hypothetical protein
VFKVDSEHTKIIDLLFDGDVADTTEHMHPQTKRRPRKYSLRLGKGSNTVMKGCGSI